MRALSALAALALVAGTAEAQSVYGHDEAADETTLTPFDVTVQGTP